MSKQLSEAAFDVLRARDLLEKRGWCKDTLQDSRGRHCILGAVIEVAEGYQVRISAALALVQREICRRSLLWPSEDEGGTLITDWNDMKHRKRAEVLRMLEQAALREGERVITEKEVFAKAREIYLEAYGHLGGKWELVETKDVWLRMAWDWLELHREEKGSEHEAADPGGTQAREGG